MSNTTATLLLLSVLVLCSTLLMLQDNSTWKDTNTIPAHKQAFRDSQVYSELRPKNMSSSSVTIWKNKDQAITGLNDVTNQTMCGCQRCFNVLVYFNISGHLQVNINDVINNRTNSSNEVSYFYVRFLGSEGLLATIVSDEDQALQKLGSLQVGTSGTYNITIKLIYDTKSSAYGLNSHQQKELNCSLCTINLNCHISVKAKVNSNLVTKNMKKFSWLPTPQLKGSKLASDRIVTTENQETFYFQGSSSLNICDTCPLSETTLKCLRGKNIIIIGDSHEQMIAKALNRYVANNTWRVLMDGAGVYHNTSPDKNITKYLNGNLPANFVSGGMLKKLRNGNYRMLKEELGNRVDGWIFSSGHWDLRDVSLEQYTERLQELFTEWDTFRRLTNATLFWNGVPPYSYKRDLWKGMERRTNVKIALADQFTKNLCKKFNVTFIPFFDIAFPFYSQSCDTHHYLCPGKRSPIGKAQMSVLLQKVCPL